MGKVDIIWLVLVSLIIYIAIFILCFAKGINFCKENKLLGILLLIISLNIIGLIIGLYLLYNSDRGKYKEWLKERKEWKKFLNSKNLTLQDYLNNKRNDKETKHHEK